MEVILHCGPHRTGAAGFQSYLQRNAASLHALGVDTLGPSETRRGLFAGVLPCTTAKMIGHVPERSPGRVALRLQRARSRGADRLLLSDTEILGCLLETVSARQLFPDAGVRVAAYGSAFETGISTILICPRSTEAYWVSALARAVQRGADVPDRAALREIAFSPRGWREVITDIGRALPGVLIRVLPFEDFRGSPDALLASALDCTAPIEVAHSWFNRAPHLPDLRRCLAERGQPVGLLPFGMGHWNPFCAAELAALRERYADDMMWLVGGADGLAKLTENRFRKRAGLSLPSGPNRKGHRHGLEERHLARPRCS
ncbi:MAG: hypothetical protein AAF636_01685 [Pseudomonadota bacterium]